jgi:hypothetical protein
MGAKRLCAPPDISQDEENLTANHKVLHRVRAIKSTGRIMGRSANAESESSLCPSEGSISWSQIEINTTVKADSTIGCLCICDPRLTLNRLSFMRYLGWGRINRDWSVSQILKIRYSNRGR